VDYSRHYEDVLRRAELFSYIAELIRSCPGGPAAPVDDSPLPTEDRPDSGEGSARVLELRDLLPRVTVVDRRVLCNGASLDLARRPLTLRLFQAFCEAPGFHLTRDEVVRRVYQLSDDQARSERFLESAYNNAVKLISRARIMAAAYLGRAAGQGIEWFVHDQEQRVWSLYRLRTQYLAERLEGHRQLG
jgi:hypothetical protein